MSSPVTDSIKRAPPIAKTGETSECCSKDQSHDAQLHMNSSMSVMKRHPSTAWTSITNMPKEIAAYAIDHPVYTDIKARDIERHSVSESLDPFQRSSLAFKSDQISEKVYVASKIAELIQTDMERFFKEVFPGLEKELRQEAEELHSAAAAAFSAVYRQLLAKSPTNANTVLQVISRSLESKNSANCEAWSTAVLDIINLLSPKDIEKDFLPLILAKSKSVIPNVRKTIAIMIKFFIARSPTLGKVLTPVITTLLEDPVPIVRGTMCQQLGPIYHNFQSKEQLNNYLVGIYKDNNPFVKQSLVITIGGIYKYPDMKSLHPFILSILKRTIKEAFVQGNLDILIVFTSYIGEIAKVMTEAGSLNGDGKLWFLDAFIQLSRYGLANLPSATDENLPTGFLNFRANMGYNRRHSLVESLVSSGAPPTATNTPSKKAVIEQGWKIRANAAKDFINFFKFAKPLVDFKLGIQPLIGDLIHDPHETVRAAMSNCFWPVMEALGNNGHILHGEFVYTLSDDSLEVIEGIAPHIAKILKVLTDGKIISPDQPTQGLVEIGGALIFCEERLSQSNSWRVHTQFLSQLTALPFCLPGDYIYNNFVPNLFHRLLHLRHLPARMGVADAIVCFLRYCRRAKQREEIRRRIKESFANGKSVQDRMLYLYMSRKIIDTFSRKYFREHFFHQTLRMADDAVANVRIKVVTMLPDMKNTLQRSEDDKLLQKLDDAAMKLRASESDRDVLNAMDEAIQGMQKIGIRFANDKAPKTKADAEDEAKEKEESFVENLEPVVSTQNSKDKGYYKSPKGVAEGVASVIILPQSNTSIQDPRKTKRSQSINQPATAVGVNDPQRFRRRTYATGEIVPIPGGNTQTKK